MESKRHNLTSAPSKSKMLQKPKLPENANPNLTSPNRKPSAAKIQKLSSTVASPNKIRDRKFVVAKKNSKIEKPKPENLKSVNCKCKVSKGKSGSKKCLCVAYDSLRASQDEFSNSETEPNLATQNSDGKLGEIEKVSEVVKRRREKLMEVARESIPVNGCGRVMHLVKAFENALTLPKSKMDDGEEMHLVKDFENALTLPKSKMDDGEENEGGEDETVKIPVWELPGLRPRAPVTEFSSPELLLTRESLGLDSCGGSCSSGSGRSNSKRDSGGGRRSRRNSSESSSTFGGSRGKRRTIKATPQQPFKLKTEQRGKSKQEEFIKKVQDMMIEQEKQRIRVAQGLPWTTDEPECLAKPPVKEKTMPVDLVLHSDMRAVERAEFDQQVQEKLSFIEQLKQERERQQKLAEEEELRRLRKELVPKAQPMPYFDRPFIPKRSEKQPTLPKEPRFHNPQQQKTYGGH